MSSLVLASALALSCSTPPSQRGSPMTTPAPTGSVMVRSLDNGGTVTASSPVLSSSAALADSTATCGGGRRMTVHFYDVGQALAALVALPDGRHVLVDTGDSPRRPGCGTACATADRHLLAQLRTDLHGAPLDLLWITHQHSDHIGGAPEVLETFKVDVYVDNGRDERKSEVRRAHQAAEQRSTAVRVVDPEHPDAAFASAGDVKLTPILPPAWPSSCSHDANECSIALRIDFCSSSLLFTGDAEHDEEAQFDPRGPVTLLQVAHHGSETSTTPGLLVKTKPKYAVISAGKPGEGMNREYCHPRALIVQRLSRVLGGPNSKTLEGFDGERCDRATRIRLDGRSGKRQALGYRERRRRGPHNHRRRDVRPGVATWPTRIGRSMSRGPCRDRHFVCGGLNRTREYAVYGMLAGHHPGT
ncbi:MAG: MBL fold metallo-hydrolase, partial [Myxococcota bacterium]|nr:MBL fold metallo-hydrolase [Myxococcota bacterium]